MKKTIVVSVLISLSLILSAQAQTSAAPTVEELQKQIQLLLSQMGSLQKEITTLKSASPTSNNTNLPNTAVTAPPPTATTPTTLTNPTSALIDESSVETTTSISAPPPQLTRSLFRGARGDDVRQLQEFLAQDPTIYPEGFASSYYGVGTEAAVKRWQTKQGLPAVGIVGRQTIAKFKELYAGIGITFPRPPTDTTVTQPNSCPALLYTPVCKEGQSSYNSQGCQVCQVKPAEDVSKLKSKTEICPALPTVDACLAGEERVVTYKSEQCGAYFACKPRVSTRANNTVAALKKVSTIQSDTRYTVMLNDPEGIQRVSVYNSKGAEIQAGYPACRTDWSSPIIGADAADFPLKLNLTDCGNPSSQYSTALSTPIVEQTVLGNVTFPYTFSNGKIVNSFSDAKSVCYANGPGSGQGIAAECETKFGVVYTQVQTTTTSVSAGRAIYSADSFASCMTKYGFGADAKQIKTWAQAADPIPWSTLSGTAQNAVQACEKEYYGTQAVETGAAMCSDGKDNDGDGFIDLADPSCAGSTTTMTQPMTTVTATTPAGQKQQIWNSFGLQSWIRTDADSARIEQLKQACVSVPTGANIWLPNSGVSTSVDFGMPNADKCRLATTCATTQYFDGASCVASTSYPTGNSGSTYAGDANSCPGFAYSRWDSSSRRYCQLNTIRSCDYNYPSYLTNGANYKSENCPATDSTTYTGGTTITTSTADCSRYGSGWHTMGSDGNCFDTSMTNYRTANGTQYSCSATPTTGCSGSTTSYTATCPSGQYWYTPPSGGSGYCQTTSTSDCTSGQYWNGTACVSSTNTSTTCASGQYWNGSSCVTSTTSSSNCSTASNCYDSSICTSSGWYWYSGGCWSSPQSASGSSTTCTSGQYWNGSACVSSTTSSGSGSGSSTCASGQYWNGTSCVTSTTTTTTCSSGQYWNGTACVNNTTPSASVYDQMRDQLKAMEIILRGLLGR